MKIQRLILENFRSVKNLTIEPEGKNLVISGANGVGKTTIYNAFTWLLGGKSSNGEKDFSPKVLDKNGNEVHELENAVEGTFLLDGGQVTLRRVFKEKWMKKKGAARRTFEGNTTDYYINGVPAKQREYEKVVADICEPEMLKILSMPNYFSEVMHWSERRNILLQLAGQGLTVERIVNENLDKLKQLPEMLSQYGTGYTIEQLQKVAKAERQKTKKELEEIPVRISELKNNISAQLVEVDEESLKEKISSLEADISVLKGKKVGLNTDTIRQEKEREIAELQIQYSKAEAEYLNDPRKKALEQKKKDLRKFNEDKKNMNYYLSMEITSLQKEISRMKTEREKHLQEWKEEKSKEYEGDGKCPCCGQKLPAAKIEELVKNFNLKKSRKLSEISAAAENVSSEKIEEKNKTLESKMKKYEEQEEEISSGEKELLELNQKINSIEEFATTEAAVALRKRGEDLRQELANHNSNFAEELAKKAAPIENEISEKNQEIQQCKNELNAIEKDRDLKMRIQELEDKETELSKAIDSAEHKLYLCEEFTRKKIEMLTNAINNEFSGIKFKLFQEQVNGGYLECCEPMIPCNSNGIGVLIPYTQANQGSKMRAGLEIINKLSEHWGIHIPVFVDNSESYNTLPKMETQLIQLRVTEEPELTIAYKED